MKLSIPVKSARGAIEALYSDTCTIYQYEKKTDAVTHITGSARSIVVANWPCRLSFSSYPATTDDRAADHVSQTIQLCLSPDIVVPPGAYIEVTRGAQTTAYRNSGTPAVYATHQEIELILDAEHP